MKRQDLITFVQRGRPRWTRLLLGTLVGCGIWQGVLFSDSLVKFDDLGVRGFILAASVPIVVLIALSIRLFYLVPKCPHCGIRLLGPLLPAAIASGNCGHCGQSLDD